MRNLRISHLQVKSSQTLTSFSELRNALLQLTNNRDTAPLTKLKTNDRRLTWKVCGGFSVLFLFETGYALKIRQLYWYTQQFLGSYYNSKNGVKILVTGQPLLQGYFNSYLTPNLGSFLLLKKSSFNSQSGVKTTTKMRLFLVLTWVVFALVGVTLTLKVE